MDILLQNICRYNICCNNIGKSLIEDIRSSNEIRYKGLVYLYDAMQKAYAEQDECIKHGMPVDDFVKFMICIDVDLLRYIAMRFTNSPIVSIEFVHQIVKDAHAMSGGKPEVASQILARATANKQLNLRYGNNKQFTYSNDCSGIGSKF